jgi:predicted nucleic acid-binding protein
MILVDTDILSALAKIDRLELLFKLFRVERLHVVPSVLGEIQVNLQRGRAFAQKVLDLIPQGRLEVLILTVEEQEYRQRVPDNFGPGERDSVAVAQARGALLLTNESRVGHFCREKRIRYFTLPSILQSLRVEGILKIQEVRQIVADLEAKDRMKFRQETLKAIFAD